MNCPDCKMPWPEGQPQCPGCQLDIEDVAAAADFLDNLDQGDRGDDQIEFTESPAGDRDRERWARAYDDLNGAPESEDDR